LVPQADFIKILSLLKISLGDQGIPKINFLWTNPGRAVGMFFVIIASRNMEKR
jgi:hypothetical protein